MEPIRVPAPPNKAFNKHRRVSDLIRKQVCHFKHLEQKLPEHLRNTLPQHHIVTEDDAARYIAQMTALLLSKASPPAQASITPVAPRKRADRTKSPGLAIAAAAEPKRKTAGTKSEAAKKLTTQPRKRKKP